MNSKSQEVIALILKYKAKCPQSQSLQIQETRATLVSKAVASRTGKTAECHTVCD
jgi:hypothetical protein